LLSMAFRVLLAASLMCVTAADNVASRICNATAFPAGVVEPFYYIKASNVVGSEENTVQALASVLAFGKRVDFHMYYTGALNNNNATGAMAMGDRLGICALHAYPYPSSTHALDFISCTSQSFVNTRIARLESQTTRCGGLSIANAITCLEEEAIRSTAHFYDVANPDSEHLLQGCAAASLVDWSQLKQCATSTQGQALLTASYHGAAMMLAKQFSSGKKGNPLGQGASMLVGGRRLLATSEGAPTTELMFGRLDPFKKQPKLDPADLPQVQAHLANPSVAVFENDGKYVFDGCRWGEAQFAAFICGRLLQEQPDEPANWDKWTWIAGLAISISSLLGGMGVAILYHQEKRWMKPDAFTRPPDIRHNPHQLLQLDKDGNLDAEYEATLDNPNLPYLQAPWADGSHKRWMKANEDTIFR